jgi:hypothetical protein
VAARRAAAERLDGRRAISVVLAGHSDARSCYPSVPSWQRAVAAFARQSPDAVFCLIGELTETSVLSASAFTRDDIDGIVKSCPSLDCFDLPLMEQLALVEASSFFVAPHTGFGTAALAVGTPWLALSGGRWHEWFFNGVPFYSAIPDTTRYPCFTGTAALAEIEADTDGEGPRTPSMSVARIREDLPELLRLQMPSSSTGSRTTRPLCRAFHVCPPRTAAIDRASTASTMCTGPFSSVTPREGLRCEDGRVRRAGAVAAWRSSSHTARRDFASSCWPAARP